MPYRNCRLRIVGTLSPAVDSAMASLSRYGAQSAFAQAVQEAILRLGDFPFDIVLAQKFSRMAVATN